MALEPRIIRPSELETTRDSPVASEFMVVDNGSTVAKTTLEKAVNAGRPLASQAEAETGVQATKAMTPLTTKQSIASEIGLSLASKAQGDTADSAIQGIVSGDNITIDNTDPRHPVISSSGGVVDGNKGDVTVSGAGTVWDIDADAVTEPKLNPSLTAIVPVAAATIAALKSVDTARFKTVLVTDEFKGGYFVWRTGDYAARAAADTLEAVYVKATTVAITSGAWVRLIVDRLNLQWFGGRGNGVFNNSPALTAAIALSTHLNNLTIYVPPNDLGSYYAFSSTVILPAGSGRLNLRGDSPANTTLLWTGNGALAYALRLDKLAVNVSYFHSIRNITLRGATTGTRWNGVLVENANYVDFQNVQLYGFNDGLTYRGTNTFSNSHRRLVMYDIANDGLVFSVFTGGGHYTFDDCTFTGNRGVYVDANSLITQIAFISCNSEQCVSAEMVIRGAVQGLTITGFRTEGCNGAYGIMLYPSVRTVAPLTNNKIAGVSITGGFFTADTAAYVPLYLGSDVGSVAGWEFTGNYSAVGTGVYFVRVGTNVFNGEVANNHSSMDMASATSTPTANVFVHNNSDSAGSLTEYRGTVVWA